MFTEYLDSVVTLMQIIPDELNMNYNLLFEVINRITTRFSSDELKDEFKSIMKDRSFVSDLHIYELIPQREKRRNGILCYLYDANSAGQKYRFGETRVETLCYRRGKILRTAAKNGTVKKIIYPVYEENRITYILVLQLTGRNISNDELTGHLLKLFNNQISLLNAKDRDYLTNLYNRQCLNKVLDSISGEISKGGGKSKFSHLAIFDIDHFKHINDNYGHLIGDEVLILVAQLLKESFRYGDMKFRYGGEELLVAFRGLDDPLCARMVDRFRSAVENYPFPKGIRLTLSGGYASFLQDGLNNPAHVVDMADRALYYAKDNGRNRCCSYKALVSEGKLSPFSEPKTSVVLF